MKSHNNCWNLPAISANSYEPECLDNSSWRRSKQIFRALPFHRSLPELEDSQAGSSREEWLGARADDEWRKLKLPPLVSLQLLQLWLALFPSSSHFPFLILDLHLSLHWLAWCWKLRLPGHLLFRRERVVGETFVCKTCRGRSIHPFQKNNITFKWNSLEPPNPIFEPRSLSRTFPFWIFHSQQEEEEGSTSHWGLPPVHSIRKMQELPWSLLSALHRCENSFGFSPENFRITNFLHFLILCWKIFLEYWWRDLILALGIVNEK